MGFLCLPLFPYSVVWGFFPFLRFYLSDREHREQQKERDKPALCWAGSRMQDLIQDPGGIMTRVKADT